MGASQNSAVSGQVEKMESHIVCGIFSVGRAPRFFVCVPASYGGFKMKFFRELTLGAICDAERTVEASLSSETPVFRQGVGDEVLVHTPAAVDLSRAPLPLITAHDQQSIPVGIVEGLSVVGGKLRGTLRFGASQRACEIWDDVVAGIVRSLSIGYQVLEFQQDGDVFFATRWQPFEISIVAVPADTTVGIGRSLTKGKNMNTNTETTIGQTRSQRRAEHRTEEDERSRAADIRIAVRSGNLDAAYADELIDSNVTVDAARAAVLRAMAQRTDETVITSQGADFYSQDNHRADGFAEACQQSLQIRSGLRVANILPQVRDVERMDLCTMAESFLSRAGKRTRGLDRASLFRAAMAISDFPNLLANTAGKSLQIGYINEATTHQMWTGEKEVQDFKPQTLVKLSEAPSLLQVLEGGEYHNGAFGDAAETFSIKTFGRIFEITRQALINDDLGAMTTLPAAFGASARRLEADQVYTKLTGAPVMADGKALFHVDHNNLAASGAVLSVTALGAARAAMRRQKGIKGLAYIDPQPRFLIVPVGLESLAEALLSSLVLYGASNNTDNLTWIRSLTLVADPRLDDSSLTAWYLAASPGQIDHIVRAYLAGQGRPYYEQKLGFETDGLSIKSRLDLGVGVIDYRGLYKNPGA